MKYAFAIAALCVAVLAIDAPAQTLSAPNERLTVGTVVPDVRMIDERGDTMSLRELAGVPLVVSPVFTSCPHVCPAITAGLIDALDGLGGCGKTFNVLTLSFDPNDSPDDLRAYREKTGMPPEWIIAAGMAPGLKRFLEAIDFRYEPLDGGGFAHANVVVFLTAEQSISGYLTGLMYTQDEAKAALRGAAGRRSLLALARPFLIPIAALFLLVALIVIFTTARKSPPAS